MSEQDAPPSAASIFATEAKKHGELDELPIAWFGDEEADQLEFGEDDSLDDDEELSETPEDIVAMLGFDPLDELRQERADALSELVRYTRLKVK